MEDFTFRIRFKLANTCSIDIEECLIEILMPNNGRTILIKSHEYDKTITIKKSKEFVVESSGWKSKQDAIREGEKCRNALMITFVNLRVGADFGNRIPKSFVTDIGLAIFAQQSGNYFLNDEYGLRVYQTSLTPQFIQSSTATYIIGINQDRFIETFRQLIGCSPNLSERHCLALELFNSSFFSNSSDTRFIILVMAIEALIERDYREGKSLEHINQLIENTENTKDLCSYENESIKRSLVILRQKSIGSSGRRFVSKWLKGNKYANKKASDFFRHCYDIRSDLVHGNTQRPSLEEVSKVSAELELFVCDLLSAMLIPSIE